MPCAVDRPVRRLLATADAVGGVWTYALDLARALAPRGIAVTLAVLGPEPSQAHRREAEGVAGLDVVWTKAPLDWLCDDPSGFAGAAELIARLAGNVDADVIQLNGVPFAAEAIYSAPVLAVHHSCLATWWASAKEGPSPLEWKWRADMVRRHLHAADAIVAPSAAFAALVEATYDLGRPVRVVYNGRSRPVDRPDAEALDALFTAGRLWDEGKNVSTLDRVAALVKAPFLAAGPTLGPNGSRLESRNLQWLGELPSAALRAWLARKPIFLSAALYEPFGLTALEAAQAGCALVLSDIPTLRELWDGAALFAPARDGTAFAAHAAALLGDPRFRARMGRAARERARRYDLDTMGARMAALYGDLVASRSSAEHAA